MLTRAQVEATSDWRERYYVQQQGFWWWVVRCGTGTRTLFKARTQKSCEEMAQELTTAFHDGLSAQALGAAEEPVAEVSYYNWNGCNIKVLPGVKSLPVGTKLYARPAPILDAKVDYDYTRTFNAIAAATRIEGAALAISCKAFWESYRSLDPDAKRPT